MADFFHMGGYAIYVWSSYALALVILVGLLVASLSALRRKERLLGSLEQGLPRRRRRQGTAAASPTAETDNTTLLMAAAMPFLHESTADLNHHHGHHGATDTGGFDGGHHGGFDAGAGQ